jgi:hypothetical protein
MRDEERLARRIKGAAEVVGIAGVSDEEVRRSRQRRFEKIRNRALNFGDDERRLFTGAEI